MQRKKGTGHDPRQLGRPKASLFLFFFFRCCFSSPSVEGHGEMLVQTPSGSSDPCRALVSSFFPLFFFFFFPLLDSFSFFPVR